MLSNQAFSSDGNKSTENNKRESVGNFFKEFGILLIKT
jgi:hypothetical protein